jgi:hypothetical protein
MNGAIVWRGVSRLDRVTPIVLAVTGLDSGSANSKTGRMAQTWILVDETHPTAAIHSGADRAICGNCYHRGSETRKRSCYVSMATGAGSVGRTMLRGGYETLSLEACSTLLAGRTLRLGAYGDPAAAPPEVWRKLLAHVDGHTGYTHQWREFSELRDVLMASVESEAEALAAQFLGWRTFRVRRVTADGVAPAMASEIVCPASEEGGHRVTCEQCQLCEGASKRAKSIAIIDHSTRARAAVRRLPMLGATL